MVAVGGEDVDKEPDVGKWVVVVVAGVDPDVVDANGVVNVGTEDGEGVFVPHVFGELDVLAECNV